MGINRSGQAFVELVAGMIFVMVVVMFIVWAIEHTQSDWAEWAHYRLQHSIKFIKGIM